MTKSWVLSFLVFPVLLVCLFRKEKESKDQSPIIDMDYYHLLLLVGIKIASQVHNSYHFLGKRHYKMLKSRIFSQRCKLCQRLFLAPEIFYLSKLLSSYIVL